MPVALIGAIGYALILISLALPGDPGRFTGALLGLVGIGFSAYLTYLELFVINAICQWCVASDAVIVLIAAASVARLQLAQKPPLGLRQST